MSEEQLKALLKKVKGDTSLQEKFKAAASPDAAVEIAKDAGFAITTATIFFFAITIIGPHTTVQAQYDGTEPPATEGTPLTEREREEGWKEKVCWDTERQDASTSERMYGKVRRDGKSQYWWRENGKSIRVRCIGGNCDRFFSLVGEAGFISSTANTPKGGQIGVRGADFDGMTIDTWHVVCVD